MTSQIDKERHSLTGSVAEIQPTMELVREQVDRILASDTFRASEALRKLLRFLAEKTFCGEAEHLKEYSVALDALGRPSTFDPRQDAVVRLQASRLRQKLDEYYRGEGANEPTIVELPRGRFKISWHSRPENLQTVPLPVASTVSPLPMETAAPAATQQPSYWRAIAVAAIAMVVILSGVVVRQSLQASSVLVASPSRLPPEMDALWSPFLASSRHIIIGFTNPLFIRFQRAGGPDMVYRTRGKYTWDDAVKAPDFSILSRALGNPKATATYNMVERSSLVSTAVLTQFLARRGREISLVRSDDLSWQQFSENDVIMLSALKSEDGQSGLPVRPPLVVDKAGVRNLMPAAGEESVYPDPPDHQQSDGEGLELVSMLPGPLGRTTVISFASNHAWGVIGGVQALTDPSFARELADKLRTSSGQVPHYYQILLKIRYRDGTPMVASYVTHRVLTPTTNSPDEPESRN